MTVMEVSPEDATGWAEFASFENEQQPATSDGWSNVSGSNTKTSSVTDVPSNVATSVLLGIDIQKSLIGCFHPVGEEVKLNILPGNYENLEQLTKDSR